MGKNIKYIIGFFYTDKEASLINWFKKKAIKEIRKKSLET